MKRARKVSRKAQQSAGAVYWHFRSKDALVDAILMRIKDDWQRVVLDRLDDGLSPMDKVDRLFTNYQELLYREPTSACFSNAPCSTPTRRFTRK